MTVATGTVSRERTVSGIIDFRTPAAGFDQPIEMWLACHERILRMLALLVRLREHVVNEGAIESAKVTATLILRYFDEAAPRHHEDEELTLFPRLLAHLHGAAGKKTARAVDALRDEHPQLEAAWAQLRPSLIEIETRAVANLDKAATADFVTAYRLHVETENEVLAPAFRRAFDEAELEAIGRAMAARRGVNWEELFASR